MSIQFYGNVISPSIFKHNIKKQIHCLTPKHSLTLPILTALVS